MRGAESDIVILATNWVNAPEALKNIDWHGPVLIDATNADMGPDPDIRDDSETKKIVIDLIDSIGFVAIDLGSLAKAGSMHQLGAPLSGRDLHFVRRLR